MTIGLVEAETPGGHSPGYFALLNDPQPNPNVTWRGDPAAFDNFPDFFIAHELAHQWWGQAVGWKNYHEQWLSEGFAQYFAALWAQQSRGDRVFLDMLRQFRRWSLSESDQGPVHLGYRLGHIKRDLRVYRALVYNKGALVLHMLRRLVGDETFFRGLSRFYDDRRFQKAGTDDFERVMEEVSGRSLDRFFERWIYGTAIPRVTYRSSTGRQRGPAAIRATGRPGVRPARHRDPDRQRRADSRRGRRAVRGRGRADHPHRRSRPPGAGESRQRGAGGVPGTIGLPASGSGSGFRLPATNDQRLTTNDQLV